MTAPTDEELGQRLEGDRPIPSAGFRGRLRRALLDACEDAPPPRLRMLVGLYGGAGTLLLCVLAAGVAGIGPLAAG